ncbi:hypothetical protein SAMN05421854_106313 [Amycolatopsis rubida]|uniref:Uncharacterized protein n=1 Tax=Amycolatopsis rubida TaxID=112413 RepID=A0A1I5SG08_9PSEU|nr:hypothetical protein SAMN05421854_106313 [Amycolatopsis rubida]
MEQAAARRSPGPDNERPPNPSGSGAVSGQLPGSALLVFRRENVPGG